MLIMKKYSWILAFAAFSFLAGCSDTEDLVIEIDNQYLESVYGPAPTFTSVENPEKNAFMEEFTGHLCGFCPPATAQANAWDATLGERLVLMSIHAGTLASVGAEPFENDYNTEVGDIYWGQLEGGFNPSARVNRVTGVANAYPFSDWETMINEELAEEPQAVLQLQANYVSEDGILNIHAHTEFLEALPNTYNLVVYVVESHIISAQEDYEQDPTEILDYEHNHLLRDAVTGAFGLPIASAPDAGNAVVKSFSYKMNDNWNAANCTVIAILVDTANGEVVNSVEFEL